MERCSRFSKCSVPRCPLDFLMRKRPKYSDDLTCTMTKTIVKRIAKNYINHLPWIENLPSRMKRRRRNTAKRHSTKSLTLKREL